MESYGDREPASRHPGVIAGSFEVVGLGNHAVQVLRCLAAVPLLPSW